jgi:hypothetical protein
MFKFLKIIILLKNQIQGIFGGSLPQNCCLQGLNIIREKYYVFPIMEGVVGGYPHKIPPLKPYTP